VSQKTRTSSAHASKLNVDRIRAADPYPHDCEATVSRNVREQGTDARPRIANPLKSIDA
jgi:hypothetical protein